MGFKFNDFSQQPVPDGQTVSAFSIALIYIAVGLTLPAFLTISLIASHLGFWASFFAVSAASLILTCVAICTGWIGGKSRVSTYLILRQSFGKWPANIFSAMLGIILLGWFSITLELFAATMQSVFLYLNIPRYVWLFCGGTLMAVTAAVGFIGLKILTIIAVPVIFIALIWMNIFSFYSFDKGDIFSFTPIDTSISLGGAISILVGAWMVGVALLPDICRFSKTPRAGAIGGFLSFGPAYIMISTLLMIPVIALGETDITALFMMTMPVLFVGILISLASWSTNDNNLYASALAFASFIPSIKKWKIAAFLGVLGTLISFLDITSYFINFLVALSIFIPPLAGVYIADYIINKDKFNSEKSRQFKLFPIISWLCGATIALFTTKGANHGLELFQLTTIPALDGILIAFGLMVLVSILSNRKNAI